MKLPNWKSTDFLSGAVLGAIATGALCWILWHPRPAPAEIAAPAEHMKGGALLVERTPTAAVPPDVKKAAKQAGGKLERAVQFTVKPRPLPPADVPRMPDISPANAGQVPTDTELVAEPRPACSCAAVHVDLGLIRMPDDTRRVVASSTDGDIVGALDIPLEAAAAPRVLHWSAGATYEPRRHEYGAYIDRDLGPLCLGLELQQRDGGVATIVRAGIRW